MTSTARWSLTEKALERLLVRLGPDAETAGREYQSLRARLQDYFALKGVERPESAADETLDRVARRLEEGEPVERIASYAHGVARLVVLEQARLQVSEQRASAGAAQDWAARANAGDEAHDETRIACLARCLQSLPAEEHALIVAYYEGAGRSHLEGRKLLASRVGLRYVTLKTRVHRLRVKLEACLRECMESGACE